MVSELGNKDFLYRLKNILGKRKKHPWGDAVGLKATRVNAIFNGRMPQVDALERIARAEHVSLDWLLLGTGNPYRYRATGITTDEERAKLLDEILRADDRPWDIHLVELKNSPYACLVLARQEAVQYEDATARFLDLEVFPEAGPVMLSQLKNYRVLRSTVDAKTFNNIARGRVGASNIFPDGEQGLLSPEAMSPPAVNELIEKMKDEQGLSSDEDDLVEMYRYMEADQKKALMILVSGIVNRDEDDATFDDELPVFEIDDPQTDEHSLQTNLSDKNKAGTFRQ